MTRDENVLLNRAEFDQRMLTLNSLPTILFIELTQNCNLSCNMCRSFSGYRRERDMDDALFGAIITELGMYATLIDLNGWGESTILADFDVKLARAIQSGARIRLVTNGHAMTPQLWSVMFSGDNAVIVSLDSSKPDHFAQLGRGNLERVIRNVKVGGDIRARSGRGELCFNAVLSSFNLDELPEIVKLAIECGVSKVLVNPLKNSPGSSLNLSRSSAQIPRILDLASSIARNAGVTLQLGASLHPPYVVKEGLPTVCSNPWTNALINHQGQIGYCHHAIGRPEYVFGSYTKGFRTTWNGPEFVELRRQHVEAETTRSVSAAFPKCTWCYHNRYGDVELRDSVMTDREISTNNRSRLYRIDLHSFDGVAFPRTEDSLSYW